MMAETNHNLPIKKTVIVAFGESDYRRLTLCAENEGIALSTYIESATIEKINATSINATNTTEVK